MEELKRIKEQLISVIQGQMVHLDCIDAKELGEVVDCVKDLAETEYYCAITKAMEDGGDLDQQQYYSRPDYEQGRMYYGGRSGRSMYNPASNGRGNSRNMNPVYYTPYMREYEPDWDPMYKNAREGRAKDARRMYMDHKEVHKDHATQMKDLEEYMKSLTEDIMEMIEEATPEEKQALQQKIATLSTKIK